MEVGVIPRQTLTSGGSSVRLDLSNYFRDPDGDRLTYTARSDDTNIVLPQVVNTSLIIRPRDTAGNTTVKVTASDGKKYVTRLIFVTVTGGGSPDLIVELVLVNKTYLAPGEKFTVTTRVRNQGMGEAPRTWLRCYNSSLREVTKASFRGLDANSFLELRRTLEAPANIGTYDYKLCIDDVPGESNIDNNCKIFTINVVTVPVQNRSPRTVGTIPNPINDNGSRADNTSIGLLQ